MTDRDPHRVAHRLLASTKDIDRNLRALLLRLLDADLFARGDVPEGVTKTAFSRGLTGRGLDDWAKLTEFGTTVAKLVKPKRWIVMATKTWFEPDGAALASPSLSARPHRLLTAALGHARLETATVWVLDVGGHGLPEQVAATLNAAELAKAKTFIARPETAEDSHP
jgi:hypothetical protein